MKKIAMTGLLMAATILSACAVDADVESDENTVDVAEEALGEGACGTFTSADPSDGRSFASLALCPASHVSPNGSYEDGLFDPCKHGYYQEVQNITAASTIRATISFGEAITWDGASQTQCENNKFSGIVYATDTAGVTVNMGTLSGHATFVPGHVLPHLPPIPAFCLSPAPTLTFARVSGDHTFTRARIVGQATYETISSFTWRKVYTAIDDDASPCP